MGNEIRGVQKVGPSGSQRNCLRFHEVHGENVKLSNLGAIAGRRDGFCKGLVFSNRPVFECEPVCIKFLEISSNWSGALRFGFTMHDPLSMKSKLPPYACPDLVSMPGNWVKAIPERIAKKGSILYFYFDINGDVHYGVDSQELGVFFSGVNACEKLWAVVDIYGNTEAIELVHFATLNKECFADAYSNLTKLSQNHISEFHRSVAIGLMEELNTRISFHAFHGKNVQLKMGSTVVVRKPNVNNFAYVFTERHLDSGEKIGLEVIHASSFSKGHFYYGITSCNPEFLSNVDLPSDPYDLMDRAEYWYAEKDENTYVENDIIMFNFSTEGEVTVVKNGFSVCANFHVDLTQPLWLFFHFGGCISEARLLGSSVSDITTDVLKQMENLKTPSKSKNNCVVCWDNPPECVIYRCGHLCICHICAKKIWQPPIEAYCPICRNPISDIIKTYK